MLRALVLALLLANAAYFAWGQGLLAAYGFAPARQSEPERLAQQIRPETMQLDVPGAPGAPPPSRPAAASSTAQCLQVGAFTERQARALRPRLQSSLPPDSWSFESSADSVRWIIYMGKYISREAMNRKRLMLQQLGLSFEPPVSPALNPGLSLGSFASKADAESVLAQMNQRGLRSAKVVPERPELASLWLKLPAADAAIRRQLDALKPQFSGQAVQACP
ncbi:MAG: SPOR domain-containing protein [Polaromonas sp.]